MNGSKSEDFLADHLEKSGLSVRRQQRIGRYEIDLVVENLVAVEVDGYHHLDPQRAATDHRKTKYVSGLGYELIRFEAGKVRDAGERAALTERIQDLVEARNKPKRSAEGDPILSTEQVELLESLREEMHTAKEREAAESEAAPDSEELDPRELMKRYLDDHFPEEGE